MASSSALLHVLVGHIYVTNMVQEFKGTFSRPNMNATEMQVCLHPVEALHLTPNAITSYDPALMHVLTMSANKWR